VTSDPQEHIPLAPGERYLMGWPAEMIRGPTRKEERGRLILTSGRCLFFRRGGLLSGGKLESPPTFALGLGELRSVSPREFSLPIGYGDHFNLPGVELNGQEFRFNRETASSEIVSAIQEARRLHAAQNGPR
jgi:hypothetical protein